MLLSRRRIPSVLHDLAGLSWFPFTKPGIRIEDYRRDGRYTLRAELPGVDPDRDISMTMENGVLRLVMVRLNESKEDGRSEFRYGTFCRTVTLPAGTKEETVKASYALGILEITMKVAEPGASGRALPGKH